MLQLCSQRLADRSALGSVDVVNVTMSSLDDCDITANQFGLPAGRGCLCAGFPGMAMWLLLANQEHDEDVVGKRYPSEKRDYGTCLRIGDEASPGSSVDIVFALGMSHEGFVPL